MRAYDRRLVVRLLAKKGFAAAPGNGTGHAVFETEGGRRVSVPLRKKDVPLAHLFPLATQLEAQGVCSRKDFLEALRQGGWNRAA